MTSSDAKTPEEYIAALPEERRAAVAEVAQVVRDNLPAGFEEGMQYGMIGWYVPLERFPDTYNGQPLGLAALASQRGTSASTSTACTGIPRPRPGSRSATRHRERL